MTNIDKTVEKYITIPIVVTLKETSNQEWNIYNIFTNR